MTKVTLTSLAGETCDYMIGLVNGRRAWRVVGDDVDAIVPCHIVAFPTHNNVVNAAYGLQVLDNKLQSAQG